MPPTAGWAVAEKVDVETYGWAVGHYSSVEDAIALAARAHKGQRYASPEREPYIFHPLRVMLSLDDPRDQIVAVLHDAVENAELELRHLAEAGYAPEVVAAVDAVTHRSDEPTPITSSASPATRSRVG